MKSFIYSSVFISIISPDCGANLTEVTRLEFYIILHYYVCFIPLMSDHKCHVTNVTVFFDDIYHRILRFISKGDTWPKRNMARGG
jgi:hypothetical protein